MYSNLYGYSKNTLLWIPEHPPGAGPRTPAARRGLRPLAAGRSPTPLGVDALPSQSVASSRLGRATPTAPASFAGRRASPSPLAVSPRRILIGELFFYTSAKLKNAFEICKMLFLSDVRGIFVILSFFVENRLVSRGVAGHPRARYYSEFFSTPGLAFRRAVYHSIAWSSVPLPYPHIFPGGVQGVSAHSLAGGAGGRRPSCRGERSKGLAPGGHTPPGE